MPDAIDLCTCGHARDEHADNGGTCLALGEGRTWYGEPLYCPCGHYDPEQDDL